MFYNNVKYKLDKNGVKKLKIAISAKGPGLEANLDSRFGRAKWIVIYDTESKEFESVDNAENYNAPQGAGIKTAAMVVDKGCSAVISGHLGPKAFDVIKRSDIKVYYKEGGSVKEAIEDFENGKLTQSNQANIQGHW